MSGRLTTAALVLALGYFPQPAQAQSIAADILIRQGSVGGRLIFGEPYAYYYRPGVAFWRPAPRRVVVVEHYAPRVVVVERLHHPGHPHGNWQRHGFQEVALFYDCDRNVYYDRYEGERPGIRRLVGYERDGRFYRDSDDRDDRD